MTMLDRMRRHKNWLKWSLILVCLAFVVFYIPDFLRNPAADPALSNTVATVGEREISGASFRRAYQSQLQAYRSAYGDKLSDQLLRQLGIDQQVLQQMVDEQAGIAEAERLGIQVGDEEVRQRIVSLPVFQENGTFIGEQRYLMVLSSQNPPVTPTEFERSMREALMLDKLRTALTEWMSVTDAELEEEYRRRNDKVKLALVELPRPTASGPMSPRATKTLRRTSRPTRNRSGYPRSGRRATSWSTWMGFRPSSSSRQPRWSSGTTRTSISIRSRIRFAPATFCFDRGEGRSRGTRAG